MNDTSSGIAYCRKLVKFHHNELQLDLISVIHILFESNYIWVVLFPVRVLGRGVKDDTIRQLWIMKDILPKDVY